MLTWALELHHGAGFAKYANDANWHSYSIFPSGSWHKGSGGLSTGIDYIFDFKFSPGEIKQTCIFGCNHNPVRTNSGYDYINGGVLEYRFLGNFGSYTPELDYHFYAKNSENDLGKIYSNEISITPKPGTYVARKPHYLQRTRASTNLTFM